MEAAQLFSTLIIMRNVSQNKDKGWSLTPAVENTEGKGTPPSVGPCGSFPGPEFSRSRRLVPSALGWEGPAPSSRLLKSLGLDPEGLERVPKESRPNGARESRPITERRDSETKQEEEPEHVFKRFQGLPENVMYSGSKALLRGQNVITSLFLQGCEGKTMPKAKCC